MNSIRRKKEESKEESRTTWLGEADLAAGGV